MITKNLWMQGKTVTKRNYLIMYSNNVIILNTVLISDEEIDNILFTTYILSLTYYRMFLNKRHTYLILSQ